MTVEEFTKTNTNTSVQWVIDDFTIGRGEPIPDVFNSANVTNWKVNQWEGIIDVETDHNYNR